MNFVFEMISALPRLSIGWIAFHFSVFQHSALANERICWVEYYSSMIKQTKRNWVECYHTYPLKFFDIIIWYIELYPFPYEYSLSQ